MRLVILPGDGIGPEISAATVQILEEVEARMRLGLVFEAHEVGLASLQAQRSTLPPTAFDAARTADGVILGPVSHSDYPTRADGGINISSELRIALDLHANIRPSRTRPGLPHYGRTPMDLVIVRENTEGFYSDRNMHLGVGEFMPTEDLALSIRKITAQASRRIAQTAFALARTRRRKVTAVHKANVIKVSEALFLREVRKVAQAYPDVAYEEQLVDSMAALLVRDAQRFDVVVTTNMFGDILSDEAAELSGGLGLGGSLNLGDAHGMAQAQHGSAPDIQGQDKANPVSLILSAAMLLRWWADQAPDRAGFARAAQAIEAAIDALLADPSRRTADLGGALGCAAFTAALSREIGARLEAGA